jgi:hypothetical protein
MTRGVVVVQQTSAFNACSHTCYPLTESFKDCPIKTYNIKYSCVLTTSVYFTFCDSINEMGMSHFKFVRDVDQVNERGVRCKFKSIITAWVWINYDKLQWITIIIITSTVETVTSCTMMVISYVIMRRCIKYTFWSQIRYERCHEW